MFVFVCVWMCVSMRMVLSLLHIPCILCNVLVTQIDSQTFSCMPTLHVILVLLRVFVCLLLLLSLMLLLLL